MGIAENVPKNKNDRMHGVNYGKRIEMQTLWLNRNQENYFRKDR